MAVHLRTATPEVAESVLDAVRSGPATWPEVYVTSGKSVIELSVLTTHKGTALNALRMQLSAIAVLFLGDDVTDENAFGELRGPDVGIKIGTGPTAASYRVGDPLSAARALGLVLAARRTWLYGERAVPIERHSMLSNRRTVALVAPDATITWLCHPQPDSSAVFADLLGGPPAGRFTAHPAGHPGLPLEQRYRPGTMTVETRCVGLTVTDFLDMGGYPDADADSSTLVRVLTGHGRVAVEFAPRPEFGQVAVGMQPLGDGLLVLGSNQPIALYAPGVEWNIVDEAGHDTATAVIDLDQIGGECVLEMRFGSNRLDPAPRQSADRQILAETPWRTWTDGLALPSTARDLVRRSALTLRGLSHEPTGSILAAATSSMPEELGGVRNWDYRYCWLRDAAMSARALVDLGSLGEAEAYLRWVEPVRGGDRRPSGAAAPALRARRQRSRSGGGPGNAARLRRVPTRTRGERRESKASPWHLRSHRRSRVCCDARQGRSS